MNLVEPENPKTVQIPYGEAFLPANTKKIILEEKIGVIVDTLRHQCDALCAIAGIMDLESSSVTGTERSSELGTPGAGSSKGLRPSALKSLPIERSVKVSVPGRRKDAKVEPKSSPAPVIPGSRSSASMKAEAVRVPGSSKSRTTMDSLEPQSPPSTPMRDDTSIPKPDEKESDTASTATPTPRALTQESHKPRVSIPDLKLAPEDFCSDNARNFLRGLRGL